MLQIYQEGSLSFHFPLDLSRSFVFIRFIAIDNRARRHATKVRAIRNASKEIARKRRDSCRQRTARSYARLFLWRTISTCPFSSPRSLGVSLCRESNRSIVAYNRGRLNFNSLSVDITHLVRKHCQIFNRYNCRGKVHDTRAVLLDSINFKTDDNATMCERLPYRFIRETELF